MQMQRIDLAQPYLGRFVVGIVATNSLEYFRQVMLARERGEVVMPLRGFDYERTNAARVSRVMEPGSTELPCSWIRAL